MATRLPRKNGPQRLSWIRYGPKVGSLARQSPLHLRRAKGGQPGWPRYACSVRVSVQRHLPPHRRKQTFAPQKAMSALPPIATAKADIRWWDRRGQRVQTLWGGVRCQTSFAAANEAAFQRTAAFLKFRICC